MFAEASAVTASLLKITSTGFLLFARCCRADLSGGAFPQARSGRRGRRLRFSYKHIQVRVLLRSRAHLRDLFILRLILDY